MLFYKQSFVIKNCFFSGYMQKAYKFKNNFLPEIFLNTGQGCMAGLDATTISTPQRTPAGAAESGVFVLKFIFKGISVLIKPLPGFYVVSKDKFYVIARNTYFSSLLFFVLNNVIMGYSRQYKSKLYLTGLRVRVEKIYKKALILKLNLCHRIRWTCRELLFFKFKKVKNAFYFCSSNLFYHKIFLFVMRRFKYPDIYKGNGIRFYKEKLKFKKRKQFGAL